MEKKAKSRKESVKTLTRLKTPVVNWPDLEKQILRGSIGLKQKP
jgi:hypothetical protein